jgi:oligopeptide transport system permease protein
MLRYALRRLLVAIPTLFVIITIAFFMMRVAPGSPFTSERQLPDAIEANVMAAYGFDRPLLVQYGDYLSKVVRFDFGPSLKYRDKDVADIIAEGFPVSATIGFASLSIALGIGMALGVIAALRQNRAGDFTIMGVAMLGISIPTFVTGPLLSLLFGILLPQWTDGRVSLPTAGLDGMRMTVRTLTLPVLTLALPQIAIISRLTRAAMIEVIRSNYVRTARAKGLSEWRIITRHTLRAALLPLVSYMGPALAGLMTGSLVVEQVFQLPGIGRQFVIGALQRDYTVVMGVVILYASLIMLMNLIADLLYGVLDPKVKYA